MIGRLVNEMSGWRDTVRARFDPAHPPVLGWQVPFLGCAASIGRLGPRWIREQYQRLGSPFTLYMMGKRITFAQDLASQHHFYMADVGEMSFFSGLAQFPGFGELIPLGLSGPEEANVGIEVLRQYLPAKVLGATAELDEAAGRFLRERLASGRADMLSTLRATIVHITARLIVGPRLAEDPNFLAAVCAFDDAMLEMLTNMFGRGPVRRGIAASRRSEALIARELLRRRDEGHDGEPRDVMDAYMRARDPNGEPISDPIMALELHGFMFGTTANTPAAAAMCLLRLLADRALYRRVIDEQEACRREHGEVVTTASMRSMPLLNACYLETLRLYAPSMHMRMTMKPLAIGRYRVPERSLVAYSPYLLHRDPAVYTDPEVFDPDRFLAGPRGPSKSPAASQFMPFGRGLHTCPGRNLARQEIILTIARLLRDFEVTLEPVKEPLAATWVTNGIAAPVGPRTLVATRR